eukprot:Gb_09619 [translate_table: standard]
MAKASSCPTHDPTCPSFQGNIYSFKGNPYARALLAVALGFSSSPPEWVFSTTAMCGFCREGADYLCSLLRTELPIWSNHAGPSGEGNSFSSGWQSPQVHPWNVQFRSLHGSWTSDNCEAKPATAE